MKQREFWINFYDDGDVYQCCDLEFDLDEDFKNTIKLREVSPELDLAISGLVEALEGLGLQCVNTGNYGPLKIRPGECKCSTCFAKQNLESYKAAVDAKGDKCPPHDWTKDGERCSKCGDKDWMT
jgi:hypothetical protein